MEGPPRLPETQADEGKNSVGEEDHEVKAQSLSIKNLGTEIKVFQTRANQIKFTSENP